MKHVIIGTAGHVDHGKTTLIRALTGRETDRLQEEKERGISIELGFAPFDLPSGRRAGVVDVPGHERFIKHMLAGVGGFDLVLLVVAADEGVMPQTREHLDILNLVGVKKGLIVLNKADLVEDDWLELVKDDVRETVKGTFLEGAPVYAVSAVTGQGIPELLQAIDKATEAIAERDTSGPFRLPVDRVFTIAGFGTVVTGTLIAGTVRVGERAIVYPAKLETRIRQIEVHDQKTETAVAGQRVALNLAGLGVEEIERGSVVASPGSLTPSTLIDARLLLLAHSDHPVENHQRLRLHTGTAEVLGRVYLLEKEELVPGESGLVQFRLEEEVAVRRGDRFVIRTYSPATTIGGGIVLEPAASRHRRFDPKVLTALKQKEKGAPEDIVAHVLESTGMAPRTTADLAKAAGLSEAETQAAVIKLVQLKKAFTFTLEDSTYYVDALACQQAVDRATQALALYHEKYPLRLGVPLEEVRARFFPEVSSRLLDPILNLPVAQELVSEGDRVRLAHHQVKFSSEQEEAVQKLLTALTKQGFTPAAPSEILSQIQPKIDGKELIAALLEQGQLVQVAEDIVFVRSTFEDAKKKVIEFIKENGSITVAELRDLLNTSRRYALPLLEYLDTKRITRRVGDKRILGPAAM
ncbi:MAG: selenocysteine-specific translation elongation factor [Firmicutes bacterium]|nr:selenocysteine-specific translation elongation factor [Bacillota bacterium]